MNINQLNLYLVGLPGSGKTTLGKILARKLAKNFFDSDQVLMEKTGVSIKTIFDVEGESGFRKREKKVIAELITKKNIVLATGGGVVVSELNRQLLHSNGVVIYLKIAPELLVDRIVKDTSRPLLCEENFLQQLKTLYQERKNYYETVSHLVYAMDGEESRSSIYRCADEIIQLIKKNNQ